MHYHLDDRHLVEKGLRNYWGYNTLSYFAPHPEYATRATAQRSVKEFKMMVRTAVFTGCPHDPRGG